MIALEKLQYRDAKGVEHTIAAGSEVPSDMPDTAELKANGAIGSAKEWERRARLVEAERLQAIAESDAAVAKATARDAAEQVRFLRSGDSGEGKDSSA